MAEFRQVTTFEEIPRRLPYSPQKRADNTHFGQLKLFLSELQFLTYCLQSRGDEGIVVYVGSAPNFKLMKLGRMFPNLKFICIDPNEHFFIDIVGGKRTNYYNSPKLADECVFLRVADRDKYSAASKFVNFFSGGVIHRGERSKFRGRNVVLRDIHAAINLPQKYIIIEDFADETLMRELAKMAANIYFISDIRTGFGELHTGAIDDFDIMYNNAQQLMFVKILRPDYYMIKYRPGYFTHDPAIIKKLTVSEKYAAVFRFCLAIGVDFADLYVRREIKYLDYDRINLQAFERAMSNETRMIGHSAKIVKYLFDPAEFEERMFYYNYEYRPNMQFAETPAAIDLGLNCGQDCTLMWAIFAAYAKKYKLRQDYFAEIAELFEILGRGI